MLPSPGVWTWSLFRKTKSTVHRFNMMTCLARFPLASYMRFFDGYNILHCYLDFLLHRYFYSGSVCTSDIYEQVDANTNDTVMVLRLSLHKNSHESPTYWSPLSFPLLLCLLLWLFLFRLMILIFQGMTSSNINTFGTYELNVVYTTHVAIVIYFLIRSLWMTVFLYLLLGVVAWALVCLILWNFSKMHDLSCSC